MEQKGMTFDHDFCYFFLLFSSLLKKEGREKENEVAKIVIKPFCSIQKMAICSNTCRITNSSVESTLPYILFLFVALQCEQFT